MFYDTQRLLWVLAEFISGPKTALLIHSYTHTSTINRTHSLQTKSPYSRTATHMYHVSVLGEPQALPGQRLPLWSCFLTESLLIRTAVLWSTIRPNPRLSAPAAGAAEWLHYVSEVPDERGNGERGWSDLYWWLLSETTAHSNKHTWHPKGEELLTFFTVIPESGPKTRGGRAHRRAAGGDQASSHCSSKKHLFHHGLFLNCPLFLLYLLLICFNVLTSLVLLLYELSFSCNFSCSYKVVCNLFLKSDI